MNYAYLRCSTNESKQDINRQKKELEKYSIDVYFMEYEHGDATTKKEQEKMFAIAKEGDSIITTEISRLCRSVKQFLDVLEIIKTNRLKLVIDNSITVDCSKGEIDPMTLAFLQMGAIFAELELNMTRQRIKSGMANAKAKGVHVGRAKTTKDDIPDAFWRFYPDWKNKRFKVNEFARLVGVSVPTIYKYKRLAEEDNSPSGGL